MTQYIYWHKVKSINRFLFRKFKINQIVGFFEKEKEWAIINKECTAIEPYVKFEYLGRTIYTSNRKENKKEFDKFMKKLEGGKK